MAAYFAEKDLARIALDLAPPAITQQLDEERTVNSVLRGMSTRAIIGDALESSVRLASALSMQDTRMSD